MEEYQQEACCVMLPLVIVLNNIYKHSKKLWLKYTCTNYY